MDIHNDPRLTAYALGELGEDERQIFEQELANAGGAADAVDSVRRWAGLLREAYAAEPVYRMTDSQRAVLLADAGALPVPVAIEEDVQHSDKILPWVTQPVISEVDKQKIAQALKPSPWRQLVPVIGSVGVAAGVVWLAAVVMGTQKPKPGEVATAGPELEAAEELSEPMVITIAPPAVGGAPGAAVLASRGVPFRYGQPLDVPAVGASGLADDLFDPSFSQFRRAAIPVVHEGESVELLRQYLADGMLPPADAAFAQELINAFDYGYDSPREGQTLVVETEVADCPWNLDRQLLQVGVRAVDGQADAAVAESVAMAVEFNPATVAGYRRIADSDPGASAQVVTEGGATVNAGETVTALYEVLPRSGDGEPNAGEMATVRIDYRNAGSPPAEAQSVEATVADVDGAQPWRDASDGFRFAASVAGFGMLLGSPGDEGPTTYDQILDLARNAATGEAKGEREEFVELVEQTRELEAAWMKSGADREEFRFASPPRAPKADKRKR